MRRKHPVAFEIFETTIIADIEFAVRADRRAIGPAPWFSDGFLGAIGQDTGDAPLGNLDQYDATIVHRHRAFGKTQSVCHQFKVAHASSSPCRDALL